MKKEAINRIMKKIYNRLLVSAILFFACNQLIAQPISKSFELRYFSKNPNANGETDFKGETAIFDTEQRVEYLKKFADYGKMFFNDPFLDTKVVLPEEIEVACKTIKAQPLPEVRQVIPMDDWKYTSYRPDLNETEKKQLDTWSQKPGVSIEDGALVIDNNAELTQTFLPQDWRLQLSWKAKSPEELLEATFTIANGFAVGMANNGSFYYSLNGEKVYGGNYKPGQFYKLQMEIDLESGSFNFYVDDMLLADFVQLPSSIKKIESLSITTSELLVLDDLWGVGYEIIEPESRTYPYQGKTFIDQDFEITPDPDGFEKIIFDDSQWPVVPYRRYAHGGERNKGETLYLRKTFEINNLQRAYLKVETVRPQAEIFINGKMVKKVGRYPEKIEVTRFLRANDKNVVAIKVAPFQVDSAQYHMNTDLWTGWFAGLIDLELVNHNHIADVYAFTEEIGSSAKLKVNVKTHATGENGFHGKLRTRLQPWYPEESAIIAGEEITEVNLVKGPEQLWQQNIDIANPQLWSSEYPNLYKLTVSLLDENNNTVIDDYVITTGIRTISQKGGTFRINNKPEMILGPLVFNHDYPLENISKNMFSPPMEKWIETILSVKKMNGNAIRMSVHDQTYAGVNDRRLAMIGDQMGIMFLWQTPAWIRTHEPDDYDFNGLPKYVKALRNHPSIIIWQVGNHPTFHMNWFEKVYHTIYQVDSSRLISPTADVARMNGAFKHPQSTLKNAHDLDNTYPSWRGKMVARGNMEQTLAYGREWSSIRKFPESFDRELEAAIPGDIRRSYLDSETHAYFDYENEEAIGQPNWNLLRGKPYYKLYSYEKDYDMGSIGRVLNFSEWQESQAWQALTVVEAYRKKRWLDFDGLSWCNLRGGPNTATYKKPLVDYHGHAKLAYHAMKMTFQKVLAGSHNVDIVIGPDDQIYPMIHNIGEQRKVDLTILVKDLSGNFISSRLYQTNLPAGRTVTQLQPWSFQPAWEGYFVLEYVVRLR